MTKRRASIADLTDLVPPPTSVSRYDFGAAEAALGFALPEDYKQIVSTYGEGAFGGYLQFVPPPDIVVAGVQLREHLQGLRDIYQSYLHEWVMPDG